MRKMLLYVRRALAALMLVCFVSLFALAPWCVGKHLAPLAKVQFWPSVAGGAILTATILAIVTILFGRWYCSVLCPLGILQDAAFIFHRKRRQASAGKVQWIFRAIFALAFVALGACGFGYALLEPYGIFGRIFTTAAGASLGVVIFALAVWRGRIWCNWVCPVGTLLGLLSKCLPTGLKIDPSKCIGCKKCERNCRASAITISGKGGQVDATKCVQCRDCTVLCPKGAISSFKAAQGGNAAAEPPQEGITRREFIIGSAATLATLAVKAADEKTVDGGFADISWPGVDKRNASLKPAGAHSISNFTSRCVGCQLCVKECPNHVLRPSMRLRDFMQPEMAFDKGFCTPDCTRCSQVCPAGAIQPVTAEEKATIHIGHAQWHSDRCLAATEGVNCTACFRHCPVNAIKRVRGKEGSLIPVVDTFACIGCGACEHVCPARPMPGMTIKAFEHHREARPMDETEALAEARQLIEERGFACAVIKDGVIIEAKKARGVSPLLSLMDEKPDSLKGAWVVDKVVGRAAAAICIATGVARVYALTASEEALLFLSTNGVRAEAFETVPRILNRDKSDLCPLEKACEGLDDPGRMVEAVRAKIALMRSQSS